MPTAAWRLRTNGISWRVQKVSDVQPAAEFVSHLLQMRAKNRGLTIHELYENDMPRLWADERAVRQICLNLLGNAIKFTPQGGEIWLKAGWTASGGQYMSVKDSGPGIPEEEIPIVLASFGQGSNSIKSAEQGAGLGLPSPADIAPLALFLCSPEASKITGQVISINWGLSA